MQRVGGFSIYANFKMQHISADAAGSELRDFLSLFDALLFLHHQGTVVRIGAQEPVIVFDDDQVAIVQQAAACIHHFTVRGSQHGITFIACDVDALVVGSGLTETTNDCARMRPCPYNSTIRSSGCIHRRSWH